MSAPIAILCSGQGTQHAGMFDLVAQVPQARSILEAAKETLDGKDVVQFIKRADEATLFTNRIGQILCCTQALAAWAMIRPRWPGPVVIAGYSVGELAAWGCAGLLGGEDVLRLAVQRAEAMDAAAGPDTGLEAVVGLSGSRVEAICRRHRAYIAIINGEDSFVVGGRTDALAAVHDEFKKAGAARAVTLKVAVASHTPLLEEASRRFDEAMSRLSLPARVPDGIRLLSGIDGDAVFDVSAGRRKLAEQISRTVNWAQCLDSCVAAGAGSVLELGPGRALSNMALQRFAPGRVRSLDEFRTPAGIFDWLKAPVQDG